VESGGIAIAESSARGMVLGAGGNGEGKMTEDLRQSYVDMIKKFGVDLDLPKVDVDRLIATHQKNFDALAQSAKVAADSVKAVAARQKEMIESTFKDALAMASELKPGGEPRQLLARQSDALERVLNSAVGGTHEIADQVQKSSSEVLKLVTDRITESFKEVRASVGSAKPKA
jgi:phasin family protein